MPTPPIFEFMKYSCRDAVAWAVQMPVCGAMINRGIVRKDVGAKSGRLIVHPTLIRSSWGLIGFLLCLIMPACGPQPPAPSVTLYLENPLLAENIDTKAITKYIKMGLFSLDMFKSLVKIFIDIYVLSYQLVYNVTT